MLRVCAAAPVCARRPGVTPDPAHGWWAHAPFSQLPEAVTPPLRRAAEVARYAAREAIFREREPSEYLWVVRRGWVQLVMRATDGKTLTVDVVTPADGICGLSAFCGTPYLTSAVAATETVLVRLPASMVRRLMAGQPAFAAAVITLFSRRFHHMAAAYATAFVPVESRIIATMLRLQEAFGATLPVTRRHVAELAGTTVETAIRVTNRLRRDRLLQMRRGEIALADPVGLAQRLCAA